MVCMECLEKQQRINELEEEVTCLKAKLRYQERTAQEGPFKSSTSSSKIPVKPNSLPERQAKRGGAKLGHSGHGSLVQAMHGVAKILESVPDRLIEAYRQSPVKHADETGWRNDGQNGYAWGFLTETLSIFRLRKTRSAKVAQEVFGEARLPGVLVVDRYNGYNKLPVAIQYCYAHLLRDVNDLEKDFPDQPEIQRFVEAFSSLLATAMELRKVETNETAFRKRATQIVSKIKQTINSEAHHPALQKIQNVFREHEDRLYHWATDRTIPAENNLAERDLRSLVIARKNSFGSQSERGSHTREVLMTVLQTLKKRGQDVYAVFKSALDRIAADATVDPYAILFESNSS